MVMTNKYLPIQSGLLTSPASSGSLGALSQPEPVTDPLRAPAMGQFSSMYAAPRAATPAPTFLDQLDSDPKKNLYLTLLRGGLNTMAAAGKPGSTGLGAIGEGYGAAITQGLKRKDEITKIAAAKAIAQQKFRQKEREIQGTATYRAGMIDLGEDKNKTAQEVLEENIRNNKEKSEIERTKQARLKTKDELEGTVSLGVRDPESGDMTYVSVNKLTETDKYNKLVGSGYLSLETLKAQREEGEFKLQEAKQSEELDNAIKELEIKTKTTNLAQKKFEKDGITTMWKLNDEGEWKTGTVNKNTNEGEYTRMSEQGWIDNDVYKSQLAGEKLVLDQQRLDFDKLTDTNRAEREIKELDLKSRVVLYSYTDDGKLTETVLHAENDADEIKKLTKAGTHLTEAGMGLDLKIKKSKEKKLEIRGRLDKATGKYEYKAIDFTDRTAVLAAIKEGFNAKIGVTDPQPGLVNLYDRDAKAFISIPEVGAQMDKVRKELEQDPAKYVGNMSVVMQAPPSSPRTQIFKLETKRDLYAGMATDVDTALREWNSGSKQVFGASGTLRSFIENTVGAANDLARVFTQSDTYLDDNGQEQPMTNSVITEQSNLSSEFLDPEIITRKLKKGGAVNMRLIQAEILQHRIAYIAARLDKPQEKLTIGDVKANMDTYNIRGLASGEDQAIGKLVEFQKRLLKELAMVESGIKEKKRIGSAGASLRAPTPSTSPAVSGTPPVGTFNATDGTFTKAKQ